MMESHNENLIRLHEKMIETNASRILILEKNVGRIPWILFGVACNFLLNALTIIIYSLRHGN